MHLVAASMFSDHNVSVPAAAQKAQRLLKNANVTANSSKKLLHRVRSKLQTAKSDITIATIVDHVDSIDSRSLGVLQALLGVLESQVSLEKFHAVQHRIFVIAARRGHDELLEYLHTSNKNTDYSFGEALETAVSHGRLSCVKVLLNRPASIRNVERALLATDSIELCQAREMIKLLLKHRLPHSVLEYLTLKMHAASGCDYDDEILDMLLEARCRNGTQSASVMEDDSSSLYAYFEIQKQSRPVSVHERVCSSSPKTSAASIQVTELWMPNRNIFSDETINNPENMYVKLLTRYLTNCAATKGTLTPWPSNIVDALLEKLPLGAEELTEYGQGISIAASSQQTAVFTRLLKYRPLAIGMLRSLRAEDIIENVEMTAALIDHLNEHYTEHRDYARYIDLLLHDACKAQHLLAAVHICSRSLVPVSILPVRHYLKAALAFEGSIENIALLLQVIKVEETDLDVLWEHVTESKAFPTDAARMLLQAGYKSPVVAKTFLRCVHANEDVPNLDMILEEWKITKLIVLREKFDYNTKRPVQSNQAAGKNHASQYFSTMAAAMDLAIESNRVDLCQLLLSKGAPLVVAGKSLLEQAIRSALAHAPLGQNTVLRLTLDFEKQRAGSQIVLDYTLLQAVKYKRPQLVADLINEGASTLAYKYECWRVVFHSKDETILSTLLATSQSALELSKSFMPIFASFTIDPKIWLSLCSRLHEGGYVNPKCYSWVLSVLCLCNKATVQSAKQLLAFGASVGDEFDQCIEQCWLHGNLPVFRVLVKTGVSQYAAQALFQSMMKDSMDPTYLPGPATQRAFQIPRSAIVFDAMGLLLNQDLPQRLKDSALCSVAASHKRPTSLRVPLLKLLLARGARLSSDGGLALLHCFLMDDTELTSQVNSSLPPMKARQAAIQFALHFPKDMGDPAPARRLNALTQLLYPSTSIPSIKLSDRSVMNVTGIFLSPNSDTPTTLIRQFYRWLRHRPPSGLSDLEHCWAVEKKLNAIFEGLVESKKQQIDFVERITAVLAWTRPEPDCTIASARYFDSFWLPRKSLSRYLIAASRAGLSPVVGALLRAGIGPNVFDESGRSALFWASSNNKSGVVLLLLDAGADLDDGSLHEAMCQQHHSIVNLLLKDGHGRMCTSPSHDDTTPLLAFVQFNHAKSEVSKFSATVDLLMSDQDFTPQFCKELKSAVEAAVTNQYAFKLILAILPWLRKSFDAQREVYEAPIARGPLRYSLLSFIDRWEYTCLNRSQQNSLVLSLQGVGFEETFYTVDGDQPGNAVNVPEIIRLAEESRKRHTAFETKECCIHGEKAESENEIYAGLMPTCATSHGWKGEIVCSDCLKQYLESRMFPHDDVTIKYKFPATKIPCWAPKCASTELSYNVLRAHTDPEIFHLYDLALCQALLREGKSMVKCATEDCPGAHWYDENDDQENAKIFFCDICFQNTCTECNDLYEKHDGEPCPAGEEARKSDRIKEEEKLSEEALKHEKRCPKCKLMYQKYVGCDHIVCGKNVYDNKVDKGCRFEFCDICFGAWPYGHTRRCAHRM